MSAGEGVSAGNGISAGDHDEGCATAHGAPTGAPAGGGDGRTLVAVFASPVADYLLRYGADMGFRGVLLEPDTGRAGGAFDAQYPRVVAGPPADLDGSVDVVV